MNLFMYSRLKAEAVVFISYKVLEDSSYIWEVYGREKNGVEPIIDK